MCVCVSGRVSVHFKGRILLLKKKKKVWKAQAVLGREGVRLQECGMIPSASDSASLTFERHFLSLPPVGSPSLPAGLPTCQHRLRVRGWKTSSPGNRCQVGPGLLQAGWAPPTQQNQGAPPSPHECRPSPPPTQNQAGGLAHLWDCWDINRTLSLVKTCAKFQLT